MDDKQFDELLESVRDMGRHMRGEAVEGARVREFPGPDIKAIPVWPLTAKGKT